MKKLLLVLALAIFCLVSTFSVFAKRSMSKNRWVQVGDKWKYEVGSGSGNYVSDKFRSVFESDGITQKIYYFDYDGFMVTGPVVIKDALFVFGDDGAAVTTGFDINGVHYSTGENGKVLGLPKHLDLSAYPHVKTINNVIVASNDVATQYDDNNNISPTAPANSQ